MITRLNRWTWFILLCAGIWCLNVFALNMSTFGISVTNGQLAIQPDALLQIPAYFGTIGMSIWVACRYARPLWISRTRRAGLSCPFCFHDLRGVPTEEAVCPECGMRYTRAGLKRYWKKILPIYYLRWSDRKLLLECGLTLPGGKSVHGSDERPEASHASPPDAHGPHVSESITHESHRDPSPPMRSAMLDTSATLVSRANRWLGTTLVFIGFWCINMLAMNMSAFGVSLTNGRLSIEPYAILQIPYFFGAILCGVWTVRRFLIPIRASRAKRGGLSCPFCFQDLRAVPGDEASCPECGMRYSRTGLQRYWNKAVPAYFLRWSDKKLLRECGLSMPDGDPVD